MIFTPGGNRGIPEHDATPASNGVVPPRDGGPGGPRWDRALRLSVTRPEPGIVLVRMSGEIDLSAVPRLGELIQQRLTAALLHGVVLDLAEVSFCDSSGLELLLEAQHRAERRGIALHITVGDGAVRRLLTLTGLADRFACHPSVAEAITDVRLHRPHW